MGFASKREDDTDRFIEGNEDFKRDLPPRDTSRSYESPKSNYSPSAPSEPLDERSYGEPNHTPPPPRDGKRKFSQRFKDDLKEKLKVVGGYALKALNLAITMGMMYLLSRGHRRRSGRRR